MTRITMREAADHSHFVSQLSKHGKVAPESDTGQTGFCLPEHCAVFTRRSHLGIEGLDVRGAALQVEHHHAFTC